MYVEPPHYGRDKKLIDGFTTAARPDQEPEAIRAWRREQDAQHPWRVKLVTWGISAVVAAVGLGAAVFFVWWLVAYQP